MNHAFDVYPSQNETASNHILDEDDKDSKRISASSPLQDTSERSHGRIDRLHSLRSTDHSQSLLQLAATFADYLCTDSRDKIYALLGVTYPGSDPNPPVDYANSRLEDFFDMLIPALASTVSSEIPNVTHYDYLTMYSPDRLIDVFRDASAVLKGLFISSSDLDSDFLAGSVRIPMHNLQRLWSREVDAGGDFLEIHEDAFRPSDGITSIELHDPALGLGPYQNVFVRVEWSSKQYKIISSIDQSQNKGWLHCKWLSVTSIRHPGHFESELCEILDCTVGGETRCICARISRAAILSKIVEHAGLKSRLSMPATTTYGSSRVCTCRPADPDIMMETPDYHPILGRLAERIREHQKSQRSAAGPSIAEPILDIEFRYIGCTRMATLIIRRGTTSFQPFG